MDYNFDTTLSNFIINDGDVNDNSVYNSIVKRLLENDLYVYGAFGNIPGIWFCKWYNNGNLSGYGKGDFFWLNTQDVTRWMKDNSETIQEYANKNPYVTVKLPEWKSNDPEIYDRYYNVLTGYFETTMAGHMSALYELGQLSDRFQIIVSQKDNNKDPITTLSSWKKFVVNSDEDYEDILTKIDANIISALNRHLIEYHFGNDVLTDEIIESLSDYMDEDFKNASYAYPQNFIVNDGECEGLDSVQVYVRKPFNPRGSEGAIQEYVWFRKWQSGFLEHGGIVNVTLSDYLVSGSYVQIPFGWKMLDKNSRAYQVSFIGDTDNNQIEVDERHETPPGDNLVSVLYELSSLKVSNSEYAPVFSSTNYVVTICPVQPTYTAAVSGLTSVLPYDGLGRYARQKNTLNHTIDHENLFKEYFRFNYDSQNTPKYYAYYAAGFIREEVKR